MTIETATAAIVEYSATTAALAELKAKFAGVKYDVATTAGMDTAKKDRRELVTLRTDLEKKRKEIKAPALAHCKLIDDEAKRITGEIESLELPIDAVIKAEENRKEAIRIEKERIAAEAQAVLDSKIIEIGKLPMKCIGKTAEEITLFLATLEARPFGGEFTGATLERAEAAKAEAVAEIKAALAAQIAAEETAAKLAEEQAIEAARQAEVAAEAARLAAIQKEENDRLQAELAEQKRLNELEAARLAEVAASETARQEEARKVEQEAADKLLKEQQAVIAEEQRLAKIEADRLAALAAEEQAKKDAIIAEEQELARKAAIIAEAARVQAEEDRKTAEKALKLSAAKCKDAATAFKQIIKVCNLPYSPDTIAEICTIAEANI